MSLRKVFITLNIKKTDFQTVIEGLHVGDVGSTELIMTLSDGVRNVEFDQSSTVTAIIHGKKPDGTEIYNPCVRDGNKIRYKLTAQDTAAAGVVDYQLDVTVNTGAGYERHFSPAFRSRVAPVIFDPVYRLLTAQPENWATNYTDYYRKVSNSYIQIEDETVPEFAENTFYMLVDPPIESVSEYLAFWAAYNRVSELFNKRLDIDTTENIVHNTDNVHKVFINAAIQGNIKGVVFTMPSFKQFALCSDGFLRIRSYDGSNYSEWQVLHLKTEINASNKNKNNLVPSIKAVVDYIAAEISGKADSADVAASLAGKADVNHTHDMSAYITSTALQSALAGKADTDHTHSQYLTEHQDLSAYALIANVTAALALKADKDTAMEYKDITGSAIYQVNDDLISDKKTIYRVFDGLGWGLMFNLITNQQHTQIILREDGHVLFRQKLKNASWHGVTFTDIFGSYVTTSAMNTALADKSDKSNTYTKIQTEGKITDDIISKLEITNDGKLVYTDDDVPYLLGTLTNLFYTKTQSDGKYLTTHQDVSGKADKSDTYTKSEVDNGFVDFVSYNQDLSELQDKASMVTTIGNNATDGQYPSAKAVKSFVEGKGYLTSHQDISGKEDTSNKDSSISSSTTAAYDAAHYPNIAALKTVYSELYGEIQSVDSSIPQATSELTNDSGFLTQHQDISGKADKATTLAGYGITNAYTKAEVNGMIPTVPTKVSDLSNDSGFLTLSTLPKYNGGVQ